jgi:thymidylate kinase
MSQAKQPRQAPLKTFTMALVGADGAGKTTIAKKILQSYPNSIKYMYMGASIDSSNFALPTSRLLSYLKRRTLRPMLASSGAVPPAALLSDDMKNRLPRGRIVKGLGLVNRVAEEWYRQFFVWAYRLCGSVVLCDRHFLFDYACRGLGSQNGKMQFSVRVHCALLNRLYPKPNLVIFLDAPTELLYRRKPEWSLDHLKRQRLGILETSRMCRNFVRVNAAQSMEKVVSDVMDSIQRFHSVSNRQFRQIDN